MAWKRKAERVEKGFLRMVNPRLYLTLQEVEMIDDLAQSQKLPRSLIIGRLVSAALEYIVRPRKKL
jgi:hypothetical protein